MSTNTITWIHLSDLHFRASGIHAWNQNIVLERLLDDIQEQMSEYGAQPDFILASGDIAFSGQPAEYVLAQSFFDDLLAQTRLHKYQLFLVPGNHDISRSAISIGAKTIADAIAQSASKTDFRQYVNEVLDSDGDRALVFKRLEAYGEFVNNYLIDPFTYSEIEPFYVRKLNLAYVCVAILGLNSAWLCYGGDKDRHRVLLGERQVRAALERAQDADLRIALLHHSFDWLHDFDRGDVEALLIEQCDFILHGHLHSPGIKQLKTPDSGAMIIAAGASYEGREKTNAYNLVRLDLREHKGKIILRRYSDERGGFWTRDVLSYRNVKNGEFSFSLPDRLWAMQKEDTRPQAYAEDKNLASWPGFQANLDIRYSMPVRIEFIETQLVGMIEVLSSSEQARHPIIGKFRSAANYLIQNDISKLKEFIQRDQDLPETVWAVLHSLEKDVGALSQEFLDFQAGMVLRRQNWGREVCEWADALLAEIGARTGEGWQGTCVFANNAVAGPNSHLVRLSLPNEDLWSLPLVVHQYASLLNITEQVASLMSFVEPSDVKMLPVLVADMLATHLAGPAYAFATILLGPNSLPDGPNLHKPVGLPIGLRFNCIIRTLERSRELYMPEVRFLRQIWQGKHLEQEGEIPKQDTTAKIWTEYADELYQQVVLLRYGAAVDHVKLKANAKKLVWDYENKAQEASLAQVDLVDILNAAWYSRMLSSQTNELFSMKKFYRGLLERKVAGVK